MSVNRLLVLLLPVFCRAAFGQDANLLTCGPMLGHISHREAGIWLAVSREVTSVEIVCRNTGTQEVSTHSYGGALGAAYNPVVIVLTNLDMNTTYTYEIKLNKKVQPFPFPLSFTTRNIWQFRGPPPDFSFLIGSCAYINDPPYDRPGEPYGRDPRIFDSMAVHQADFMIWGGDNVYTREADFSSRSGFYYRYMHDRCIPEMKRLLMCRPNYAIWDDHDFGPNDDGASFELKTQALETFKAFWANPGYGEPGNPGIYTKFNWSDCEFFLVDDRFYRTDEAMNDSLFDKPYLGPAQLQWLENALLTSKASFKFLVFGNQVLNPVNDFECYQHYPDEWNHLLQFIKVNRIRGVVFLSGDRHFSEIIRREYPGMYPLYDITSSAMTSRSFPKFSETKEANNPYRVVPSAVVDQNFMKITVTGPKRGERIARIACYGVNNQVFWEYEIRQADLRWE